MLVGLDCETTGSVFRRHSLVQIGIYLPNGEQFYSRVGWHTFESNPESLKVIQMSEDEIRSGPADADVDRDLVAWCESNALAEKSLVPVGWGVSTFDLPFVARTFPEFTSRHLSHRTAELNAVCYALSNVKTYNDELKDFDFWKHAAKYASEIRAASIGIKPDWHNAGYDAMTSLFAWDWLRQIIAHPAPSSSKLRRPQSGGIGQLLP